MESRKPEAVRPIPPTRERLNDALELLAQFRAAKSPEEARHMFVLAFTEVESRIPKAQRRLNLGSAEDMPVIPHDGKNIRVSWYKSHILYLGEHGAIEVCLYPRTEAPEDTAEVVQRHAEFTVVFEKAGADGKRMWEK